MAVLITLLGISMLVVLHELGHFGVARAFDMRVVRFSIGFGPTLVRRQVGETQWQVAAIPLGGFVQIDGMGPAEDGEPEPAAEDPRSYRNKPAWQRALVIFAGPASNWCITAGLLAALATTSGLVRYDESEARLGDLVAQGPAAAGGLLAGDVVRRIDGQPVADWPALVTIVRQHPEQALHFEVQRGTLTLERTVTPRRAGGGTGVMEAMPSAHIDHFGPLDGLVAGAAGAWHLTEQQAQMLWGMVTGAGSGHLAGLPGIVKTVSAQAEQSLGRLAESLAWLSIGLCLLNLLPVPALDGSRLLFLLVEVVRRRPLDERVEGLIHTAGFVVLLAMMLFVSVRDLL